MEKVAKGEEVPMPTRLFKESIARVSVSKYTSPLIDEVALALRVRLPPEFMARRFDPLKFFT